MVLEWVVREGHDTVVLDAVQDPLLGDGVLASVGGGGLPHHDAGGAGPGTQIPAPAHDQLLQVAEGGAALAADEHTANICKVKDG